MFDLVDIFLNNVFLRFLWFIFIDIPVWIVKSIFNLIVFLFNKLVGKEKHMGSNNEFSGTVIFTGPVQMGDNNTQMIDKFSSYLEHVSINDTNVKNLLTALQGLVANSNNLNEKEKVKVSNGLLQIADELGKTTEIQDKNRLKQLWSGIMSVIKDAGEILGVASSLGKILGLPIP